MALRAFDRRLRDGGRMVPTEAVRVNQGHPLAQGLALLLVPGVSNADLSGNGLVAYAAGTGATPPSIGGTGRGPSVGLPTSANALQIAANPILRPLSSLIVAVYARSLVAVSGGVYQRLLDQRYLNGWVLCLTGATSTNAPVANAIMLGGSGSSSSFLLGGTTSVGGDGIIHDFAGSFDSGAAAVYLDGVSQNSMTAPFTSFTYSNDPLTIGNDDTSNPWNEQFPSDILRIAIYSNIASASIIPALASAPFSMLERAGRIAVWDVGASGGVPFSASAGLGFLLFAGDPLTAAAGASLSLGSGILDFTGAAPSIAAAAALATGLGAEPLSGFSPTVAAGVSLSLGSSILDFTGLDSSPSAGASLIAGLGELILTGLPVTVTIGGTPLQVTMGLGSLVTNGGAAAISAGAQISVGTGATQSAGESFAISAGANLTASLGTIWLSGQLPGVSAGANLTAGEQVLLLEGYPATVSTGAIPVAITAGLGAIQFLGLQPTVNALASYAYTFTLPTDVLEVALPVDVLTVTLPPR